MVKYNFITPLSIVLVVGISQCLVQKTRMMGLNICRDVSVSLYHNAESGVCHNS